MKGVNKIYEHEGCQENICTWRVTRNYMYMKGVKKINEHEGCQEKRT